MKTCLYFQTWGRTSLTHFEQTFVIFMLLVAGRTFSTEPPGQPTVICPSFIAEADSKRCECQARFLEARPPDFSLSWPGHSDTPFLQLTRVTRRDNGSLFTCLMVWNAHRTTATYVLQVAYGPDDNHTAIKGPRTFITDGTKPLTLTCQASDVNPSPVYTWDTTRCDSHDMETGTCTFTPDPLRDDGRQMRCNAVSNAGINNMGSAVFTLNLNYPPTDPPVITSYASGGLLAPGSRLECNVHGGKPAVSGVSFYCENQEQIHVTSLTSRSGTSTVSTFVTIDETRGKNRTILCSCRGIWEPEKELYTQTAQIAMSLEVREDACNNTRRVLTAGTIGAVLGVITCIILFCCWKRKCFRKFTDWFDHHKINASEIHA